MPRPADPTKVAQCDFCDYPYFTRSIAAHERKCFSNPENRGCQSCVWSLRTPDKKFALIRDCEHQRDGTKRMHCPLWERRKELENAR